MKIFIEIECDSDAFDGNVDGELSRILRDLSDHVMFSMRNHKLLDYNGNVVGKFELEV